MPKRTDGALLGFITTVTVTGSCFLAFIDTGGGSRYNPFAPFTVSVVLAFVILLSFSYDLVYMC
jgi:hypothetical protein